MRFKQFLALFENRAQRLLDISNLFDDEKQRLAFQALIPLLSPRSETRKMIEYVFFKDHIPLMQEFSEKFNLDNGFDRSNHFYFRFIYDNKIIHIRSTGKDPFKQRSNANSAGRKLANAGELATILSLTKDIESPYDTEQQFFIDNPEFFDSWKNTFTQTRKAITKIVGNISLFDIVHDATDKSEFSNLIQKIQNRAKPSSRSRGVWNPSDIYLIKKTSRKNVEKKLKYVLDNYSDNEFVQQINQLILQLYHDGELYPISLKQIISNEPKISYENVHQDLQVSNEPIQIQKINCNLGMDSSEIGLFNFQVLGTNRVITMQYRGFPHGYTVAQVEVVRDGSQTGGRLGKVPTAVVDSVMKEYGDTRISSISFFGKDYFKNFDHARINEVYNWFKIVKKYKFVNIAKDLSLTEFTELVEKAKKDPDIAAKLAIKIQGLKLAKFFCENHKDITDIMWKMINGAKKVGTSNSFYIKVY